MRVSKFHRGLIAVALAAGIASSCGGKTPQVAKGPVPVLVTRVQQTSVPVMVEYVAHAESIQQIDLVPRVEGVLEGVYFRNGSVVHRGQILMQIQQDQYLAAVQAAQGDLDKAQAQLVRAKSNVQNQTAEAKLAQALAAYQYQKTQLARIGPLAAKLAVSQQDYDQTKTQYDIAVADVVAARANLQDVLLNQSTSVLDAQGSLAQAEAQLTNAKLNLSYTVISSPVTGIISFIQVDQGNYVSPAKTPTLATVAAIDPIKIIFQLSESDYIKLAPRLRSMQNKRLPPLLQLYLSDGSLYPYRGTPTNLNNAIDQQTGTISVEAIFPNTEALLRPGEFARVDFPISIQPNALLVPQAAVQSLQGASTVYVLGPQNKLQLRTVETGTNYNNDVIIESGVKAGESVVVGGGTNLQPDMTVAPTQAPAKR
ncbi:MAG TPA: efflux RND transporter periplasmic adaptor subunit [Candidatus Acidoferrales bacterium]|nr:efflux RND transporter periplasmic adaptor subunit [Candidatus Acidoferrales bacterium]